MYTKYFYDIKIEKIVDGDTFDCAIDVGFNIWIKQRVRMQGIDAPETRTRDKIEKAKGIEAKDFLSKSCYDATKQGSKIQLLSHGTGKYGRLLGELFIDGVNINQKMVDDGFAETYY